MSEQPLAELRECYGKSRRGAAAVLVCAHCKRERTFTGREAKRAQRQRFCSYECRDAAARTRVDRSCEACGRVFMTTPARAAGGRARFCSVACRSSGQRRRVESVCEECGKTFALRPSEARKRAARFCSSACVALHRAKRRPVFVCARCGDSFARSPSLRQGAQTFCSLRCAYQRGDLIGTTRFKCEACSKWFESRSWRHPRFCSLACTNRGRRRTRRPEDEARNARIRELSMQGLRSPAIVERLLAERVDWLLTPAAVRQVLARAR